MNPAPGCSEKPGPWVPVSAWRTEAARTIGVPTYRLAERGTQGRTCSKQPEMRPTFFYTSFYERAICTRKFHCAPLCKAG